jgi:heme exporter protein CcmD
MVERGIAMNLHELFAMGNYGVYVWSAYGITLAVFALNLIINYREMKIVRKIFQQQHTGAERT